MIEKIIQYHNVVINKYWLLLFVGGGVKKLCGGSKHAIERMLAFGRELYNYSQQLFHENGSHEQNKKMLQV